MHNKQGYSNINLLLGACKVIYMLNEIKVKMRKNSIVFKLAETFCHRWPSYWKLAQLLVWQCSFLHNLPSHAWNDGLKLLSVLQRTWASCYGKKEEATSLSGAWGCYSTSASLQTIPSKEGTHQGLLSQNCSFPPHLWFGNHQDCVSASFVIKFPYQITSDVFPNSSMQLPRGILF